MVYQSIGSCYVGMTQVKYDVIGTQKAFKLGEDS